MRDGVPLPGSTPPALISLLAHRVFGPLRRDRVRAVLDYHGLADHPAGRRSVVAPRHGITAPTVSNWCWAVQAAGSRLPLSIELATDCTRRTRPGEDHLGRVRIAAALGLQAPRRPAPIPDHSGPPAGDLAAAGIAARVLAAAGRLPLTVLHAAVGRARRFRSARPVTAGRLTAALTAAGVVRDDRGRWRAPGDVPVPDRYRALVAIAAGRDLTRREMTAALVSAGYAATSAGTQKISTHPLVRHVGPDRYRIVGDP